MRRVALLVGCLAVAGLACWAAAPLARAYEPPEPLTFADPIGDAVAPEGGGPAGPDITSVTVSQPDSGTLRLVLTFADPLVLRETAPVVEDGVRVMLGHQLGSQSFENFAAWVGAADPSRVLLTDLSKPWRPGSVFTGGSAQVDGRTLTLTIEPGLLRARTRSDRPVDPGLPLTVSVRTSLGWAIRRAPRRFRRRPTSAMSHRIPTSRSRSRGPGLRGPPCSRVRCLRAPPEQRHSPRLSCWAPTRWPRIRVGWQSSGRTPRRSPRSSGSSRMLSYSAQAADGRRSLVAVALVMAVLSASGCQSGPGLSRAAAASAPQRVASFGPSFSGMAADGAGVLWWSGGSVSRFDPATGALRTFTADDDPAFAMQQRTVTSVLGGVWLLESGRVRRFDGERFFPALPTPVEFCQLAEGGEGACSASACRPRADCPRLPLVPERLGARWSRAGRGGRCPELLGVETSGGLWFQQYGVINGLAHWDAGTWTTYDEAGGMPLGWGPVALAGGGGVWVGGEGGVARLPQGQWTPTADSGLAWVVSMVEVGGALWMAGRARDPWSPIEQGDSNPVLVARWTAAGGSDTDRRAGWTCSSPTWGRNCPWPPRAAGSGRRAPRVSSASTAPGGPRCLRPWRRPMRSGCWWRLGAKPGSSTGACRGGSRAAGGRRPRLTAGPGNPVVDLAQGPRGSLWAASRSRLLRFDGTRWRGVADLARLTGMPPGDAGFASIAVAPDGAVWAMTDGGRLVRVGQGVSVPQPGPAQYGDLQIATDGTVWASSWGAAGGVSVRGADGRWAPESPWPGDEAAQGCTADLAVAPRGVWAVRRCWTPWESEAAELAQFDGSRWTLHHDADGRPFGSIAEMAVTSQGSLIVASESGLLARDTAGWTGFSPDSYGSVAVAPDGVLWLADATGVYRYRP